MQVSKEIAELNELLRGRWVSGLWNLDHTERQSDEKQTAQREPGSRKQPDQN